MKSAGAAIAILASVVTLLAATPAIATAVTNPHHGIECVYTPVLPKKIALGPDGAVVTARLRVTGASKCKVNFTEHTALYYKNYYGSPLLSLTFRTPNEPIRTRIDADAIGGGYGGVQHFAHSTCHAYSTNGKYRYSCRTVNTTTVIKYKGLAEIAGHKSTNHHKLIFKVKTKRCNYISREVPVDAIAELQVFSPSTGKWVDIHRFAHIGTNGVETWATPTTHRLRTHPIRLKQEQTHNAFGAKSGIVDFKQKIYNG